MYVGGLVSHVWAVARLRAMQQHGVHSLYCSMLVRQHWCVDVWASGQLMR